MMEENSRQHKFQVVSWVLLTSLVMFTVRSSSGKKTAESFEKLAVFQKNFKKHVKCVQGDHSCSEISDNQKKPSTVGKSLVNFSGIDKTPHNSGSRV